MSALRIDYVGEPRLSAQRATKEFHFDNTPPKDLTVSRGSYELSSEEKLAVLRDFLKKKYGL